MYRTGSVPCHESVKGYKSDQEWITGQRSKLYLVTSGLRNFLDYGGGKRVRRKGYVDASLTPIRIALRRDTGYVL